jgi:hypothetical protein
MSASPRLGMAPFMTHCAFVPPLLSASLSWFAASGSSVATTSLPATFDDLSWSSTATSSGLPWHSTRPGQQRWKESKGAEQTEMERTQSCWTNLTATHGCTAIYVGNKCTLLGCCMQQRLPCGHIGGSYFYYSLTFVILDLNLFRFTYI